jgi:hypothetical protein
MGFSPKRILALAILISLKKYSLIKLIFVTQNYINVAKAKKQNGLKPKYSFQFYPRAKARGNS